METVQLREEWVHYSNLCKLMMGAQPCQIRANGGPAICIVELHCAPFDIPATSIGVLAMLIAFDGSRQQSIARLQKLQVISI